jgi:hypothetical protein
MSIADIILDPTANIGDWTPTTDVDTFDPTVGAGAFILRMLDEIEPPADWDSGAITFDPYI